MGGRRDSKGDVKFLTTECTDDTQADLRCLRALGPFIIVVSFMQASEKTGIKMTIRHVFAGNAREQTIYVQGDRKRTEFRDSAIPDEAGKLVYPLRRRLTFSTPKRHNRA